MSEKLVLLLLLFSGIVWGNLEEKFATSSGQFSTKIYQNVAGSRSGNVIMSPLSIQSAVSLVYFGATGKTADELKQGLQYRAIPKDQVAESFSQLGEKIKSTVGLDIANKIFIKNGFSVKPSFNEIASKSFSSETQSLNFEDRSEAAGIINNWVESKTNNKIKDLVKADSLNAQTRMVLVNAIYFKGAWVYQFDKRGTYPMSFYLNEQDTVDTDFMFLRKRLPYASLPEFSASVLELPYKNSEISMMIILPDSKTGLPELEAKISELNIVGLSSRLSSRHQVVVRIPKFKIETEIDLEDPLTAMGMGRMFTDDAEFYDLLAISKPVKVSKVVHKAFIEVNEEGAEAAAATAIQISVLSASFARINYFTADHPFLFVLKTRTQILFMGRYVAPN